MRVKALLLVEDCPADEELVRAKLAGSKLEIEEVLVATSLAEAILVLGEQDVSVVLLDLDLGDSKSLNTLRAVRAVTDAAIIVVFDHANELLGVEAMKAGADDYIVKPELTEALLAKTIGSCLTRRKLRQTAKSINAKFDQLAALAGS